MQHIACEVGFDMIENLIIGSNEEAAIRRAIRETMPFATNILCTRHLRKNFEDRLTHQTGVDDKKRHELTNKVFGNNGLIFADDTVIFDIRKEEIISDLEKLEKKDSFEHFKDRLVHLLYNNVFVPCRKRDIGIGWTNKNAESANHKIKTHNNWKALPLPQLIDKLTELYVMQDTDIKKAIVGIGNYDLAPHMVNYRVTAQLWSKMSASERNKRVQKFVCDTRIHNADSRICSSSDNKLVVKKAMGSKKPSQRKRNRAERSYTHKKDKGFIVDLTNCNI